MIKCVRDDFAGCVRRAVRRIDVIGSVVDTAADREKMEDSLDDQDDQNSAVETESNCSYEETAAKIEMVLRRNLRLDMVDGNDDKQLLQPTVGMSSLSSLAYAGPSFGFKLPTEG